MSGNSLSARVFLRLTRHLARIIAVVLLGGLGAATLVRFSPGFGVDQRELDSRLSQHSIDAIKESHADEVSLVSFYLGYMHGLLRGDFGISHEFHRPSLGLIEERSGVTLQALLYALPTAWAAALIIAAVVTASRSVGLELVTSLVAGALLAVPVTMVAIFTAISGRGAGLALAVVLAPVLFRYISNIFEKIFRQPYILAARSRGIRTIPLFFRQVLPNAAPELIGLAGVSLSMAFGALIPVETICDLPGIGHLALLAALARDLPLLVSMTLFITLSTLTVNMIADVINQSWTARSI